MEKTCKIFVYLSSRKNKGWGESYSLSFLVLDQSFDSAAKTKVAGTNVTLYFIHITEICLRFATKWNFAGTKTRNIKFSPKKTCSYFMINSRKLSETV